MKLPIPRRKIRLRYRVNYTAPVKKAPLPRLSSVRKVGDELVESRKLTREQWRQEFEDQSSEWLRLVGLENGKAVQKSGGWLKLHPLVIDDVLNIPQRAKAEMYDNGLFLVVRGVTWKDTLQPEQMSLFLNENTLISFHEKGTEHLEQSALNISKKISRFSPAFVLYVLLDTVIDSYFPVIDRLTDQLEEIEHEVLWNPEKETMLKLYDIKRDLLMLRRSVWPMREVMNQLRTVDESLLPSEIQPLLRDCNDHVLQVLDLIESDREIASGLIDIYLSNMSHKLNEVMKVLTVMAAIFIPLTFVAGIYGMNFNTESSPWNMPELNWYWGYPACLGFMLAITSGLLFYFRRRKWI